MKSQELLNAMKEIQSSPGYRNGNRDLVRLNDLANDLLRLQTYCQNYEQKTRMDRVIAEDKGE